MPNPLATILEAREHVDQAKAEYLAAVAAARGTMPANRLARELGLSRQRLYQLWDEADRAAAAGSKLKATVETIERAEGLPFEDAERDFRAFIEHVHARRFGKWNAGDKAEQLERSRHNSILHAGPGTKGYRRAARTGPLPRYIKDEHLEEAEGIALNTLERAALDDPRIARLLEQVEANRAARLEAPIPF